MNLFALTRDDARRIVRFPLSKEVQRAVEESFAQQERDFISGVQEEIVFDGKYKPDDGECLKIDDYVDQHSLASAINDPLSVPEIRPDTAEFEDIRALFSGRTGDEKTVILIQGFDRRKVLSTRGVSFFHSGDIYKRIEGIGLTLDTRLTAILDGRTLKFFSFHVVRQMLNLAKYYKEATDDDLREFAGNAKIEVKDIGKFVSESDSWIRRKVALVMQSGILDNIDIDEVKRTAAIFRISIEIKRSDGQSFLVLPEIKAEIKKVLCFLDEDYYQSVILGTPYLSNSKRAVL